MAGCRFRVIVRSRNLRFAVVISHLGPRDVAVYVAKKIEIACLPGSAEDPSFISYKDSTKHTNFICEVT